MYEYTLINEVEKDDKLAQFQEERIQAFDKIEDRLENLTLTVSDGFSSVYNLLPDLFGFLPVPTLGSASLIFSL